MTSLIGFFSARSQGDEKLYQAEIINFALATPNSLTLHFSQKMKKGEKKKRLLFFPFSLFFDSIPLLASFFFSSSDSRRCINGGNVRFVLKHN